MAILRSKSSVNLAAALQRRKEEEEREKTGETVSCGTMIYTRLFLDLREDDDDFEVVLRKIVVSVGLILAIFPICFVFYMAFEMSQQMSLGGLVTLITMMVFPLLWVPTFLYVRMTQTLPSALMDLWLFGTILGVGVLSVCFIEYPIAQLNIFLAVLSLLCNTPRLPLHLVLLLIVYIVASANSAFSGLSRDPDIDLLAIPEAYRGTVLERIAYNATCLAIGLIIGSALAMQTRERQRHEHAAHSAIEVSRTIAEQLSIYDVDSVKRTIEDCTSEGVVDPELLQHLGVIADNLEAYRPHLPNWMLNDFHVHEVDADHGDDDDDTDADLSVTVDHGTSSTELTSTNRSSDGTGTFKLLRSSQAPQSTVIQRGVPKSPRAGGKPGSANVSPTTAALASGGGHQRQTYFAGKVTMASVSFVVRKKISVREREELMASFIDRVHQIASQTGAALHTFIGDQVFASWNATSRVAQPEAKACRFLLRASEITTSLSTVQLSGAAFTGDARCILAGHKHSAFTISFRWRDTLRALATFCQRHGAFAVDPSTRSATQYDVITRGVDALLVNDWKTREQTAQRASSSFTSGSGLRVISVYELVREIDDNEQNDEWMYVLRRSANNEGGDRIINLCLAGDFDQALERLESEMETTVQELRSRASSSAQLPVGHIAGIAVVADSPTSNDAAAAGAKRPTSSQDGESPSPDKASGKKPGKAWSSVHSLHSIEDDDSGMGDTFTNVSGGGVSATAHSMRLMHNLYEKIERFQRERLNPNQFPEDFSFATWKSSM